MTPEEQAVGITLRTLRERAGLTQAEVARAAGLSTMALFSVESSRHLPTLRHLRAIAAALGQDAGPLEAMVERALVARWRAR